MATFLRIPIPTAAIVVGACLTGIFAGAFGATTKARLAKQFLNSGAQKPPGYSTVVTSAPGKMIFIAGRGGSGSDFESQAKNTFEELKKCLALAGASFDDLVKINYFVSDMSHTAELRRIRASYLNMENPPAATLVQVGLAQGQLLEVEAIAMVPAR
jgi:enamine deaminase RidA (YjgF/YER057c/UK114 family)